MRKIKIKTVKKKKKKLMADSGIAGLCQPQYFVHIGLMLWDTSRDQFDFFNIRRIIKLLLYN